MNSILPIVSLVLSFIALIFSFITLRKNYFSRFKPLTLVGSLSLRIYPFKSGKEKWFIPSFDVPINIANDAACPGKVLSIRIVVNFPKLPIQNNKEVFYPKWEVDTEKFNKIGKERLEWIKNAVVNDWMPFIILSKTSISKHIVFEARWEDPVIQEEVLFTMEIFTEPEKKWRQIGKWTLPLTEVEWSELTENGTSIGAFNQDAYQIQKEEIHPRDLHKYTGTKNTIPKGGFNAEPSYLAYPTEKKEKKQE